MFTTHIKNGKVYLVFKSSYDAWDFFDANNLEMEACIVCFGQYENAIELTPIMDDAGAHADALAHGKEWDHEQIL